MDEGSSLNDGHVWEPWCNKWREQVNIVKNFSESGLCLMFPIRSREGCSAMLNAGGILISKR
ncbi:MAG: hypothetical protein ACI828_001806 [Flavobacteriales bacterium]|jgi:hypothetical protein